jgi:murein DD-endopeptidase MepM/ murein hydrolase activator NlpD
VKGDTLLSIANKHKGDLNEIMDYNNLSKDDPLKVGDIVVIPDGEPMASAPIAAAPKIKTSVTAKVASVALGVQIASAQTDSSGYYMRPITAGTKTQGIHGSNGVDLADSCGTPIYASAAGSVVIAKEGGYNGGYGSYVVIDHDNGSQTLYAHMQNVVTTEGVTVQKGQQIGTIGATGKVHGVTGCHVHFEIRGGGRNPF